MKVTYFIIDLATILFIVDVSDEKNPGQLISELADIKLREEKKLAKLIRRKPEEIDFDDIYYVYG